MTSADDPYDRYIESMRSEGLLDEGDRATGTPMVPPKGRFDCAERDCPKGSRTTGDAVFRISPKGERFIGLCAEHYAEWKAQHG